MSDAFIWSVVIGMGLANFAVRFAPIAVVSRMRIPRPIMRWLSFIPVAVMGSLVAGQVVLVEGDLVAPWSNPYALAAVPTALIYHKTRSFLGSVVAGMVIFIALRTVM